MKKRHKNFINNVQVGSIAEEAGIEKGDILLSINGQVVLDYFDYRFLIANENILLEIEKTNGEIWETEIEKDEYEDIGVDFTDDLMDEAKECINKCLFCFIDQLPKNMRESLYFKDDDSRLSFLTGNYVTLTNMNDSDMERILNYKMSPINISVHSTNPDLRISMLNNKNAGNILKRIRALVSGGITVNAQIVLCRKVNDDIELDRTINDLTTLYPGVQSISVVPVGITKWREGLFELLPFDRESSIKVLKKVHSWQEKLLNEKGSRVVYLGDEFYINAEHKLPECNEYEGFPQIENGVGMMSLFKEEFYEELEKLKRDIFLKGDAILKAPKRNISIATGISAYGNILKMVEDLKRIFVNIDCTVYPVINNFFGERITVTGLLTGRDIIEQLKEKPLGEELLVSRTMFKADEFLMLDDYKIDDLSKELGVTITIVDNDGSDFAGKIIGEG